MADLQVKTSSYTLAMREGSRIYYCILRVPRDLQDVKEGWAPVEELLGGDTCTLLIDQRFSDIPPKEVREYWVRALDERVKALAAITLSRLGRFFGNLMMGFTREKFEAKIFAVPKDAGDWLKKYDHREFLWEEFQKLVKETFVSETPSRSQLQVSFFRETGAFFVEFKGEVFTKSIAEELQKYLADHLAPQDGKVTLVSAPPADLRLERSAQKILANLDQVNRLIVVEDGNDFNFLSTLFKRVFKPKFELVLVKDADEAFRVIQNRGVARRFTPDRLDDLGVLEEALARIATQEFNKKIDVKTLKEPTLRRIGLAINVLGEELSYAVVSRHDLETALSISVKKEKQISAERALQKQILENLPMGIFLKDVSQGLRITFWNKTTEKLLGVPREDVIQKTVNELVPDGEAKIQNEIDQKVIESGQIVEIPKMEMKTRDRGIVPFHVTKIPVKDAETGKALYLMILLEDLSEKLERDRRIQEAEAKSMQAGKLASLGEMAAGIGHEINNPLSILQGKAELLLKSLKGGQFDSAKAVQELEKMVHHSERIARIVRGLKSFSRDSTHDPMTLVELKTIIGNTLDLMEAKFKGKGVTLKVGKVPRISLRCRAIQIEQVLVNLLNNSFDEVSKLKEKWVKIDFELRGERVRLSVTDSGAGIPDDLAVKIMQPFFTTKEVGKGTGLGLSISKGIVEEHGGMFFYDSSSPHTCFVMEFPVIQASRRAA